MQNRLKISIPEKKIIEFCKENHIRKLSFFGSVLREDFGSHSDVDVLVEFEPGQGPGFFGLSHMQRELSQILEGREVDLRTPGELSRYFRDEVLSSAQVQYAQG
jgi:predicted nucleotidyltransferase